MLSLLSHFAVDVYGRAYLASISNCDNSDNTITKDVATRDIGKNRQSIQGTLAFQLRPCLDGRTRDLQVRFRSTLPLVEVKD